MAAKIIVVNPCVFCNKEYEVAVDFADFEKYANGALVKVAFPSPKYSADDREFLISSICPHCQSKFFD